MGKYCRATKCHHPLVTPARAHLAVLLLEKEMLSVPLNRRFGEYYQYDVLREHSSRLCCRFSCSY